MPNEWYVKLMGEEIGPLTDDGLREMVAKRRLTPDDLIRKWKFGNWLPASKVRGLFPLNAAPEMAATELKRPSPSTSNLSATVDVPREGRATPIVIDSHNAPSASLATCPDCGKRVSKLATMCPNCGRPLSAESRREIKVEHGPSGTSRRGVRWGLVLAVAIPFVVLGMIGASVDDSHDGTNNSHSGTSGTSLRKDTTATINQQVYNRVRDLAVANDITGIESLIAAGQSVTLAKGTQVRIVDLGIFTSEIKVESGPHAGRYFIVATESINR